MGSPRTRPEIEPLLGMAPSEATPWLLELAARQAARRRPADLVRQYAGDGFVEPAPLDLRRAHALDGVALDAAKEFEALLLAPVAPLGACSVVAPTSQDRTLATTRGTEVVSDPTNVLALECARRLRRDASAHVRLCTIHQVLRAQPLPPVPGFTRHFRMLALAEAGRGAPEDRFEVDAVVRHLRVFERFLSACAAGAAAGQSMPVARRARVLASSGREPLQRRVCDALRRDQPQLEVIADAFESRYYAGLRVLLDVDPDGRGDFVNLGDTGRFDWVAQLTGNRKMRFIASGLGLQRVPFVLARGCC